MAQIILPSKLLSFCLMFLLPLFHSGCFPSICLAKKSPFDITTDTSALVAFRHHLLTTPHNNILRNNWTYGLNITVANSMCHWIGVTCGARRQRVVSLDLSDMGLTGTIPSYFGNLSFLRYIDIGKNKFHGQLPIEMARLHRLSILDVGFNSLSGNIPAWFGLLPQLTYLDIHNNSFTGPNPPSLSNASKLENLNISSNLVNGMIPVELGNLHNLKYLDMSFNQLTGVIPHSIFNLTMLETFHSFSNGISGSLPDDMCIGLSKLTHLGLGDNELEGHIPSSSLQFCSRLENLSLSYNKFHGPLTAALGNLTMLNLLFLGGNNLKDSSLVLVQNSDGAPVWFSAVSQFGPSSVLEVHMDSELNILMQPVPLVVEFPPPQFPEGPLQEFTAFSSNDLLPFSEAPVEIPGVGHACLGDSTETPLLIGSIQVLPRKDVEGVPKDDASFKESTE